MIEVTVKIDGRRVEQVRITNTKKIDSFGQTIYSVSAYERMPSPDIVHNPVDGYWMLIILACQRFYLADTRSSVKKRR